MKKLLALLLLLPCSSFAADTAIGSLGAVTTVPDAYVTVWAETGVQDVKITFLNLTNQILAGYAGKAYAQGLTNGYVGQDVFTMTNGFLGKATADQTFIIQTVTNSNPLAVGITGNAATATAATTGPFGGQIITNLMASSTHLIVSNSIIVAQTNDNSGFYVTNGATRYVVLTNGAIASSGNASIGSTLVLKAVSKSASALILDSSTGDLGFGTDAANNKMILKNAGNLIVSGSATATNIFTGGTVSATNLVLGSYACMTMATGTVVVATSTSTNLFTAWSHTNSFGTIGWTNGQGVATCNTMVVSNAGNYRISFGCSLLGGNSDVVKALVFTNYVHCGIVTFEKTMQNPAIAETGFKEFVVALPAMTPVSLYIANGSATSVNVQNLCFNLKGAN